MGIVIFFFFPVIYFKDARRNELKCRRHHASLVTEPLPLLGRSVPLTKTFAKRWKLVGGGDAMIADPPYLWA